MTGTVCHDSERWRGTHPSFLRRQLRAAIWVEPKGMALEGACGDAAYQPGGASARAQCGVRPPHGLQSGPMPRCPEGAVGVELGEEAPWGG